MRIAKEWLFGAMLVAVLGGMALFVGLNAGGSVTAEERVVGDHWAHHDGHWSFWHEADHRWYYTDGLHWFFYDGRAWDLYRFDKHFGHKYFEHGTYKVPGPAVEIVLPRHVVHHPH